MFTKNHYKAIAKMLQDSFGDDLFTHYAPSLFVDKLVDYFKADNPLFDKGRFLAACGLPDIDSED
ncbi:MAG: hypothetical protein KKD77_21195 [Gammaproteobacteria bacterium]|nr:hypothetical protein [Gammaproteobacteria bacterium]